MNNILKVSLIVVVVLVIAGGLFFAGSMFGRFAGGNMPMFGNAQGNQRFQPNGQNDRMMPGQRPGGNMPSQRGDRMGGGMMDQGDRPGMGMDGRGPGMGGGPGRNQANLTPVTSDEAKKAAQDYITSLKLTGLEVGEVLIVDVHAYVSVKETATGNGAFELMVDPFDKVAHPAMGPASMWNLKYGGVLQADGMMGRMGRGGPKGQNPAATATPSAAAAATPADVSADMPLSQADALKAAQAYLDREYAGATAGTTALKFYGYYSIDFSKDGKVIGKLSVNGYNGQVVGQYRP